MKKLLLSFSLLIITGLFNVLNAQVGALDSSFGSNGIVLTDFNASEEYGETLCTQPDGKILVAGKRYANGIAVVRYNNDGSIDNTFGNNGKVFTSSTFGNTFGGWYGCSLTLQVDGKILIGGANTVNNEVDFAIVRYTSNGSIDNTFGIGGMAKVSMGDFSETIYSIMVQPDEKIIVAGRNSITNYYDFNFALARFNSDGTLDNSFGTGGKIITNLGPFSEGYSVTSQSDGKILVAGTAIDPTDYKYGFTVVRYNNDGTLDLSFGNGGIVKTLIGDGAYGQSIHVQTDNKILVTGFYRILDDYSFSAIRYNNNGSLDNTFGTNGIVTHFSSPSLYMVGKSIIQPDGKIVTVGYNAVSSGYDILVARLNSNGSLDLNFGTNGFTSIQSQSNYLTPFGGQGIGYGIAVGLDNNEKIVVAGNSYINLDYDFILFRLNGDAINEITLNDKTDNRIKIHPNPSNNYITIENNNYQLNSTYVILNSLGQQVFSGQLTGEVNTVDISGLSEGIYFVEIGEQTFKLIKN